MIRHLLLTLDDGDDGARAVDWTRSIAERGAADVLLLRVGDWPLFGIGASYGWCPTLRACRLTTVRNSLATTPRGNVRVLSPQVLTSESILEKARGDKVSLIVVAYHPEGAWTRFLRGHTSQRILWDSPIPVLAVPEQDRRRPPAGSRILYVHNGDDSALQGSRIAIDVAQLFEARVGLLQARLCAPPRPGILSRWFAASSEAASKETSSGEDLMRLFEKRGVTAATLPGGGEAAAAVAAAIPEHAVDLVILAKPRRGGRICDALARHVLQDLRVPLLVLRDRPAQRLDSPPPSFRFRI